MGVFCIVVAIDRMLLEFFMNFLSKKCVFLEKIYHFMFSWSFMLFPTFLEKKCVLNIEKCPFTYWLNGRWFLQMVDREFEHVVKWKVVFPDSR